MKKRIYRVFGLAVFLGSFLAFWATKEAVAVDLWFNFRFGPPPILVAEPPAVVMIPHSQVYFVSAR